MTLLQDTRYGLRMMTKTPVTSLVAILSLTIGLGASAAIFSFVNAFLLRRGALPALRGTKVDVVEAMKAGGYGAVQGRSRARSVLVVTQVSVCTVLLVAGSLCLRSLQSARTIKPGFDPDGVFVAVS